MGSLLRAYVVVAVDASVPQALATIAFFILMGALAAGVLYAGYFIRKKRTEQCALWAAELGLAFSPYDSTGIASLPFAFFSQGRGSGVNNVATGSHQGMDVHVFDAWWWEYRGSGKSRRKVIHYYTAAICQLPMRGSHCVIGRENLMTRLAGAVGFDDIEMESEEFNRMFRISATDRRFSSYLIDARMMSWLMTTSSRWGFEVSDRWAFCSEERSRATTFTDVLARLTEFRTQIPSVVLDVYAER